MAKNIKDKKKQVVLVVLDGWGHREEKKDNGIAEANTPTFDRLTKEYPHTLLEASGRAVGLPQGQIGNSEVGHINIGAGTVVFTDLVRISDSINKKVFGTIPTVKKLFTHVKKNKSSLHLMGLIGTGGVHAYSEHLIGILKTAKLAGIKNIYIHAFTDGRDTPPQSAVKFLEELEVTIKKLGVGYIATMCGRYLAMDRDNNWDRVEKAEQLIFEGKGNIVRDDTASGVAQTYYGNGVFDEHFQPTVFLDKKEVSHHIEKNDGVFFFNFRSDRARMLSKLILAKKKKLNLFFATMTQYDKNLKSEVVFKPVTISTTLAKELSYAKVTQAHIAETEKFAHATYFLNGGEQKPYKGERHILIDSRKDVATHDLAPEMKVKEIADATIKEIEKGTGFIFLNFANADMVGHTANKDAIKIAIEATDRELGRVVEAAEKHGATVFITADHGNAEVTVDPITGKKHTAHTTNPVPLIITDKKIKIASGKFSLSSITPTILSFLGLKLPKVMDAKKLIK